MVQHILYHIPMTDAPTKTPVWDENLLRDPHAQADKRDRVRRMFAAIAPSYDLNNRLHSLWQDQRWRRKAVKLAGVKPTDVVMDVASGTGDLSIGFAREMRRSTSPHDHDNRSRVGGRVFAIDFTFPMLPLARHKFTTAKFDSQILCINGDAQSLPLPTESADVVSIAFGIRNMQDPLAALREFRRVLRHGGRVIILEFSQPTNRVIRRLNDLYCCRIMPHTATWISGDRTGAYKYLPMSVRTFLDRERMMQTMREAGFDDVEAFPMTFGVCVCYRGFVRS